MKRPEDDLQALCFQWLRLARPDVFAFAIPNGGHRNKITAARLRRTGVTPGVADIGVLIVGGVGFIEMKAGKGVQSDAQCGFEDECFIRGIPYQVCRSLEAFQGVIAAWCPRPRFERKRSAA